MKQRFVIGVKNDPLKLLFFVVDAETQANAEAVVAEQTGYTPEIALCLPVSPIKENDAIPVGYYNLS